MRKHRTCFVTAPRWPQSIRAYGEMIEVIGRFHFLVMSRSEDGYHVVDLEPQEDWPDGGCTCRGFTTRRECRHFNAVCQLIGLDTHG